MESKQPKKVKIAGWKETIDLPDWKIFNLLAKLDTGANSSAIDVSDVRELENDQIEFRILASRKDKQLAKTVSATLTGKTRIKSSNGQVQNRYKVETRVQLGSRIFPVQFTLVSRRSMICRALLGRRALAGNFLVNSSEKYLHGARKKPKIKSQHSN